MGVFILLYVYIDRKTRKYTVTNKRVLSKEGWFTSRIKEVSINDIRSIDVTQDISGRFCGYGTVKIASAGTEGDPVSFFAIKDPIHVRDLVRVAKSEADSRRSK